MRDVKQKTTKNNRQMLQGICVVCGMKKSKFVSASGKEFLNDTINSLAFEMHMPGHNFTRPGTKVSKRLNEDMIPKAWPKPINRVDKAVYHHDICYAKNKDTKTRNEISDKNMLTELNCIYNHTLRERMERGVVSTIIGTKKRFGWGLKETSTARVSIGVCNWQMNFTNPPSKIFQNEKYM